jgi:hypothetical protein
MHINVKYILKSFVVILIWHVFIIAIVQDSFKYYNSYFLYVMSLIVIGYTILYYALALLIYLVISKGKITFNMRFLLLVLPVLINLLITAFFFMKLIKVI